MTVNFLILIITSGLRKIIYERNVSISLNFLNIYHKSKMFEGAGFNVKIFLPHVDWISLDIKIYMSR